YFFFFSSRRRHTRSKRDWSSDVCSSDLGGEHLRILGEAAIEIGQLLVGELRRIESLQGPPFVEQGGVRAGDGLCQPFDDGREFRSEERRVGKECRQRGVGGG